MSASHEDGAGSTAALDLDRLLAMLDVRVEPFAVCDVREGGVLPFEAQSCSTFHYVLVGGGVLNVEEHGTYEIGPHSVVICPPGLAHRLTPGTGEASVTEIPDETQCAEVVEGLAWLRAGRGERRTLMACGRLHAGCGEALGLFDRLRRPVVESFATNPRLRQAFHSLLEELAEPRPGAPELRAILMKECLIHVLRRLYEREDTAIPWLSALSDPRLVPALDAILRHPADELSIDRLAELSGMSRSAFCHHFTHTLGVPPHEFLSERRLEHAARLLRHTRLPVKTVAGRVGFKSRSHFTHAFRARYGIDPLGYRTTGEEREAREKGAAGAAIPLPS